MASVIVALGFTAPHPPPWSHAWYVGALCIHRHESVNWHLYNPPYAGGFEFMLSTWNSVGRPARSLHDVAAASPSEQLRRAYLVWKRDGDWHEWPNTSRLCGLR